MPCLQGLTKTGINPSLNEGANTDLTDCTDGGCCPRIMVLPLAFPFGRLPLVQGALPCGMFTQGVAPFHSACPGLRGAAPSGRAFATFLQDWRFILVYRLAVDAKPVRVMMWKAENLSLLRNFSAYRIIKGSPEPFASTARGLFRFLSNPMTRNLNTDLTDITDK